MASEDPANCFRDPLQFAYQPHIGVEDAIIFMTPVVPGEAGKHRESHVL